jgi:hypothetical protein
MQKTRFYHKWLYTEESIKEVQTLYYTTPRLYVSNGIVVRLSVPEMFLSLHTRALVLPVTLNGRTR